MRSLLKPLKLAVIGNINSKKIDVHLEKAIVSFTFDDVPIPAVTNGARILEHHDARGTYYVTLGLEHPNQKDRKFLNREEIQQLYYCGHDIGCHTYSHLDISATKLRQVEKDCDQNIGAIKSILGSNVPVEHFAYPFGKLSLKSKKALASRYLSMRSTEYGINSNGTDLRFLRSVCLYSKSFDRNAIEAILQNAIDKKSWLIFHTHEVMDNPSAWGIGINDFEWLVNLCSVSDCQIKTIKDAYHGLAQI